MLALRRHSPLSSIPTLSFAKGPPRVTKLAPKQMSSMATSRLRQLYQQMGAAGSRTFSTATTTSSTSGHMDSGKISSLSSPQTKTSNQTAENQPSDSPPVLFKSEFAARRFVLNRPSVLNALNHDMIKMIKEKVDVSVIPFGFCSQFAMRDYKYSCNWLCETT
jgi:hypothetical protein